MLEKLDIKNYENKQQLVWFGIINKINEIVELLNAITIDVDGTKCIDGSKKPADPYAEQRKWIGYLCWFWDDVYGLKTAGVLEEITTIEEEFHYAKKDTCTVWKHCEPVKPEDPIIYKGEKNVKHTPKNMQQDYVITYMSDGHIKKFYGHNSIVELEAPLPQGTRITIKSITKGGNNE